MSHLCAHCGEACNVNQTKLSDWEMREVQSRAEAICAEWPAMTIDDRMRRRPSHGRQSHLKALAEEYGINIRTLYRYMRRAT